MKYTEKYVENLERKLKALQKESEQGYVILKQTGTFEWTEFTAMVGTSPVDAISKVFMDRKAEGVYVAVSGKDWAQRVNFDEPVRRTA